MNKLAIDKPLGIPPDSDRFENLCHANIMEFHLCQGRLLKPIEHFTSAIRPS
jgi:hypothetical protein